jgi:uncharacterized membrane protein (UPF0127 family)
VCALGALAVFACGFGACTDDDGSGTSATALIPTSTVVAISISEALATGPSKLSVTVDDDCLDVLVADTADERSVGLSDRDDLGAFDGMLFAWDTDVDTSFYMYRTRIPLSIGWYAADGTPVDRADMTPCPEPVAADCPLYEAEGRYRYALETAAGDLGGGPLTTC